MKIKALVLMAVSSAAALGPLIAQVNPITLTVPPGFCLLANHLDHAGGNTLNAVLPGVPPGSQVLKFGNNFYTRDDFSLEDGGWIDAETLEPSVRTISPGEGFFFFNPDSRNLSLTFTGEVRQGVSCVPIRGGSFSLVGSPVPRPVSLTAPDGLPRVTGMQILRYRCAEHRYQAFIWDLYWQDSETLEPVDSGSPIPVGEGFFLYNPGPSVSWCANFSVE